MYKAKIRSTDMSRDFEIEVKNHSTIAGLYREVESWVFNNFSKASSQPNIAYFENESRISSVQVLGYMIENRVCR